MVLAVAVVVVVVVVVVAVVAAHVCGNGAPVDGVGAVGVSVSADAHDAAGGGHSHRV